VLNIRVKTMDSNEFRLAVKEQGATVNDLKVKIEEVS